MTQFIVYKNDEFGSVRTLTIDGEPYFVGKDVAEILGYKNPQDAIRTHVDAEDKGVSEILTPGGIQKMPIINESGLYSLILSSKLPKAKLFKRWVTADVLPSIRKHGLYAIDEIIANPDLAIAAFQALKAEREAKMELETQHAIQSQQIAEMAPKVSYYDLVLRCPDALPISIIAKDYGWSAKRMNQFLHEQGIQYKLRKTWLLYADHADKGYTRSETYPYKDSDGNVHNSINTKWTQSGRLFIYSLMTGAGHFPLMEKNV